MIQLIILSRYFYVVFLFGSRPVSFPLFCDVALAIKNCSVRSANKTGMMHLVSVPIEE